jgi:hypothetical protein
MLKEIKIKNVTDSTITITASLFLNDFIGHHYFLLDTILSIVSSAFPAPNATQSKGVSAI